MTDTSRPTPDYLLPTACHVCGGTEKSHDRTERPGSGRLHSYWSNADASAEAREHDSRTTLAYPSGATTPEAAYVAECRPA